jgi:GTPase SAR1 family protein
MGQGGVGKTAMVLRFTTGDFNEQVRRPSRRSRRFNSTRTTDAGSPYPAGCTRPAPTAPRPLQYMPTIGDMYTKDIEVDGAPRHIEIDDTAGQVRRRGRRLRRVVAGGQTCASGAWHGCANTALTASPPARPLPRARRRHTQTSRRRR